MVAHSKEKHIDRPAPIGPQARPFNGPFSLIERGGRFLSFLLLAPNAPHNQDHSPHRDRRQVPR